MKQTRKRPVETTKNNNLEWRGEEGHESVRIIENDPECIGSNKTLVTAPKKKSSDDLASQVYIF